MGHTFTLYLLPQLLNLFEGFVGGRLELLASGFRASDCAFQFNIELEFVLLKILELGEYRPENRLDEVCCWRGHGCVQIELWHAGMRGQVAQIHLGRRHCDSRSVTFNA